MVTISKPLSAGQAQAYHANEFTSAEQNYYTQGNQIRGEWQGRLAESWNLRGEVSEEAFSRLAAGQHPETGEQLVRYQQAREYTNEAGDVVKTMEHRAGWDATFSAPKSVSLTALVGSDERVREAHQEAVRTALDEMERYTQARIGGNAPAETTGQWVVAKFEHDSARPVDGYAAPQLHTHAVFFNLTETEDGRAHAVQPQELYRSQQYGTAIYQSELAWRLKELGYEIEPGKNGAPEIRGYSQEYLEASSPRSQQIKEHLAEQGVDGAGAAQIAAHRTRDAKLSLSPDEMLARHRDMAEAFGNQPERIVEAAKEKMHVIDHDHDARLKPAQSAVTFARDRNMEREAVVDERALMRDALKRSMGQAMFIDVQQHFESRIEKGDLVEVKTAVGRSFTTPEMMTLERDNIERMRGGQDQYQPLVEQQNHFEHLSNSQRNAVDTILESRDQITGLQGAAGAGKTTSLAGLREAAEKEGYAVEGFAPTSRAAYQLEEAGIKATTLQHHLAQGERAHDGGRHLYFVDESSLASTKQVHDFFERLNENDRVVLVGDTRQHQAVDAGRPFEQMQEAGMRTARLDEIVRQKDPALKETVEQLARGEVREAVERLSAQGRVHEISEPQERAPFTQTETGPNGVTTTTLDGFGRPVLVARGDTSGVHSYTANVYAPCACSPLGKVQQVSQPYQSGGSASNWTKYTYDGLGRTVSVQQPDGASTTTYSYSGNQTTVTDPAGKSKQFTKDVLGNLTTVVEPDPANPPGGTLTTTYTYDWMGHVTQVSMPRGATTQTRTFVYNTAGLLTSATNPENGTATYTYSGDNTLHYKQDAKGQVTAYTYDTLKHLIETQQYPSGLTGAEDICGRVTYAWGTDPTNVYDYGRLVQVQAYAPSYGSPAGCGWANAHYGFYNSGTATDAYVESYLYDIPGAVVGKTLGLERTFPDGSQGGAGVGVNYAYDTAGRLATVTYPMTFTDSQGNQPLLTMAYDTMGRPSTLADSNNTYWVSGEQYDYAGRMTSLNYLTGYGSGSQAAASEARTYNANTGQLASLAWSGAGVWGLVQYAYLPTQNNGQITQATDTVSGETIAYQYDALKRLTSAASTPINGSTPTAWTQTYQYDGFGNLTAKVLNGTTTPIAVNALTNRLSNASYDLNGNMTSGVGATLTYDEANRMATAQETSGGQEYYGYDASNKRVYRVTASGQEQITVYGAYGEKLGVYGIQAGSCNYSYGYGSSPCVTGFTPLSTSIWFAGRLIMDSGNGVVQDRLGTNRVSGARFYPYGDEITSTSNDREKFATYTRDSYTGLDYADQRFYASTYGRFNTADPKRTSAHVRNPGSWNRYAYALGDPVNGNDPSGLDTTDVCSDDGDNGDCGAGGVMIGGDTAGLINNCNGLSGYCDPTATGNAAELTTTVTFPTENGGSVSSSYFSFQTLPNAGLGDFLNSLLSNPYLQLGASLFTVAAAIGPAVEGNPGPFEEAAPGVEEAIEEIEAGGPSFIGQSSGPAIPVPAGATGPTPAINGNGIVFNGGAGGNGLAPNVNGVRIMGPTGYSPTGYVNYGSTQANGGWQTVDPYTGVSLGRGDPAWHIPLAPRP